MTAKGRSTTERSCPSCGETPMFRSQVHDCCVLVEEQRSRLVAVREALFDTSLVPEAQVRTAIRALTDDARSQS